MSTRVLLVEDDPSDADLIELAVRRAVPDLEIRQVYTEKEFLRELDAFNPALVISDHKLPQFSGHRALELCRHHDPHRPFLLVTGLGVNVFIIEKWDEPAFKAKETEKGA